jgi:hypothetical protein
MIFLMNFLLHRTCYQSKSFENLQQLKRKPLMNTLEKLSVANFTIKILEGSCEHINIMTDERKLPK